MSPSTNSDCTLDLFTRLLSLTAIAQLIKVYYSLSAKFYILNLAIIGLLLSSVTYALLTSNKSCSLLLLAFSYATSLIFQGSQSNHVIVSITVAISTLLTYNSDRKQWRRQLANLLFFVLILLYIIPFIHKLNDDFLDPNVSCSSLFISGFLSMIFPVPHPGSSLFIAIDLIIRTAPLQAVALELTLPFLLILWRIQREASGTIPKLFFVLGATFHLMVCIPLPPMSVYPFSMVMVPIFAIALPNSSVQLFKKLSDNLVLVGLVVAVVTALLQGLLLSILQGEPMPREYPPYNMWSIWLVWSIIVWITIAFVAVTAPTSSADDEDWGVVKTSSTVSGWVVTLVLVVVGLSPYLGLRTYPALAMFSNLRTEGPAPNHLLHSWLAHLDMTGLQAEYATIHDTNLESLTHFQVDLGRNLVSRTKAFNQVFGLSSEFWIAPPVGAWRPTAEESPSRFVPFSLPLIELQKRVSTHILIHAANSPHFFVNFTMHTKSAPEGKYYFFEYGDNVTANSVRNAGIFRLVEPVDSLKSILFRFRSFDSSYSPCRH